MSSFLETAPSGRFSFMQKKRGSGLHPLLPENKGR